MLKNINDCIEYRGKVKTVSRTENNKTFTLVSDKDFDCEIIGIDECVFRNESRRRCDFLFVVPKHLKINTHLKSATAYYVELKGNDLRNACEQLFNTIEATRHQLPNYKIEARVITTTGKYPNLLQSQFYRKVKKIIKTDIQFCKVHKGNNFNHREALTN